MTRVRQPACAGAFYPAQAVQLQAMVVRLLAAAESSTVAPKAIIAPHAGYIYSGSVAASAYARLAPVRSAIERVVLLGPAHRCRFDGLAASDADVFETPLGDVDVDTEALAKTLILPQVQVIEAAHTREHCLEVQLPFLQVMLADFRMVPLLVGRATPADVTEVLDVLWGGDETLIVVSSDLSHYHDYQTAKSLDCRSARAIETLSAEELGEDQACGRTAVAGLLKRARSRGLHAQTVDLRNSGDTAGPCDQVVGYGAFVFS